MSHPVAEPIEIVCLSRGEWRLCDGRLPPHDSRRLISYVNEMDEGVEVLWLPSLTVQTLPTLLDAVDAAQSFCDQTPTAAIP